MRQQKKPEAARTLRTTSGFVVQVFYESEL